MGKDKIRVSNKAYNSLLKDAQKAERSRIRKKDSSDTATNEQVLDPNTRMIIFKILNSELVSEIHGVVNTGKESRVFHASGPNGQHYAIKIFKTSLNEFKDRRKYIEGEHRFRNEHRTNRLNPRRLVRLWAEKEFKNLKLLQNAGIPCPEPILLRKHVLLMSFIGDDRWSAPHLKDVQFKTEKKLKSVYLELIGLMRKMYQEAHLVHADLSEFNILYHDRKVHIIDVSQAVEHDHPNSLEFLRKDCQHVVDFFRRKGLLNLLSIQQLFNFITDKSIPSENIDSYVETILKQNEEKDVSAADEVTEEVFKHSFIPRTLQDIEDPCSQMSCANKDAPEEQTQKDVFFLTVTGLHGAFQPQGDEGIPDEKEDEQEEEEEEEGDPLEL